MLHHRRNLSPVVCVVVLCSTALYWGGILVYSRRNEKQTLGRTLYSPVDMHCTDRHSRDTVCHQALPSCIIIGVSKCGTKALIEYMSIHPDIRVVRDPEELHFFDLRYGKGLEWYRKQMPCTHRRQIAVEKTPMYFHDKQVPKRIFRMNSDIRLVVIVRDPLIRAISEYAMSKAVSWFWNVSGTFEQNVLNADGTVNSMSRFIRHSLYDIDMKLWLQTFSVSQIHVVDGDTLVRKPMKELHQVESFLGLPPCITSNRFVYNNSKGFPCFIGDNSTVQCLGNTKGREHPTINTEAVRALKDYFRPHNLEFFKLLGKKFDWD